MSELNEILQCEQERQNPEDSYAVSVMKDDTIVGHVPHEISRVVWYFIKHDVLWSVKSPNNERMVKALKPLV